MIPCEYRLKLSSKVRFVGSKQRGNWTTIITTPSPSPKWAVRISKHVISLSTGRNRLRRQINQWLYKNKELLINQSILIIIMHQPTNKAEFDKMCNELQICFKQTRL